MNKILTSIISFLAIAFLMVMVSIPSAYGAIVFVGQASSTTSNSTNPSVQMSYTGGNTLIVACSSYSNPSIDSVTDGVNTYVRDALSTSAADQSIWRASNISSASTTVTVKCNGTAGTGGWNLFVNEYSGLANTNPVDASSSNSGTSATADPGAITTSNANDLIFGASINNVVPSTVTLAPNFTLRGNGSGAAEPAWDFDQIVSATGTYDASSTYSTSGIYGAASVAYKATAAAAVAPTLPTSDITYY